jgi:hypothetical protein
MGVAWWRYCNMRGVAGDILGVAALLYIHSV